ncbi:MAG: insulinase family protein [Chloroflexota bacterium]|nr:insulinase family protein [Chloroflexota bacterium]
MKGVAPNGVVDTRPVPGTPRPYEFPPVSRSRLSNGMGLLVVDLPGRPLVSATIILPNGAVDEAAAQAGATVLAARALSEGTERYDAVGLVEAAERLGASLHAEAGWDATSGGVDVPAARLEPALDLLAEMMARPTFPEAEIDRLRDERLNDLLQARADPRRRADEAFVETIYTLASPYHRPSGGTRDTVTRLDSRRIRAAYARGFDPGRATLIVGGDLTGLDVPGIADRLFGSLRQDAGARTNKRIVAQPGIDSRLVRVIHRPGAVQTEIRIGHLGLPRRVPDFHAVSVMSAILGGLFNSRLNMKLREEKGYTYGASAGFDMRRAAGPFAARAAVNTEVTVPAVADFLAELERIREPVGEAELRAARDFLVGVFPLRFETPGAVVGALSALVVHDLSDDELTRYREAIEAVTIDDVSRAAQEHINLDRAAIVLVGDADAFASELEAAGFGPVVVERDEGPAAEGPEAGVEDELGPVDDGNGGPLAPGGEPTGEPAGEPVVDATPAEGVDDR